jgi:hypothetical protein
MRNFLLLSVLFMAFGCGKSNYATYQPVYARVNWEEQPDYSQLKNWAAHPQKIDPSDSIPASILKKHQPKQLAAPNNLFRSCNAEWLVCIFKRYCIKY